MTCVCKTRGVPQAIDITLCVLCRLQVGSGVQWGMSELPVDYTFWLEQGMDPTHANFLHHTCETAAGPAVTLQQLTRVKGLRLGGVPCRWTARTVLCLLSECWVMVRATQFGLLVPVCGSNTPCEPCCICCMIAAL